MNRRTLEQGYLGLLGILVLVAVLGFIWPNYSSASRTSAKISSLESKIGPVSYTHLTLPTNREV